MGRNKNKDNRSAGEDAKKEAGEESFLTSSTLGKRRRGVDAMESDSDSEDEEVKSVLSVVSVDEADKDNNPTIAPRIPGREDDEYTHRIRQKAEMPTGRQRDLLTVFSSHEIEGMAQRRSDVRKAAKKKKKRLQKSEAGLVDVWNQGMDLPSDDDNQEKRKSQHSNGLFHVPEPASPPKKQDEVEEEL